MGDLEETRIIVRSLTRISLILRRLDVDSGSLSQHLLLGYCLRAQDHNPPISWGLKEIIIALSSGTWDSPTMALLTNTIVVSSLSAKRMLANSILVVPLFGELIKIYLFLNTYPIVRKPGDFFYGSDIYLFHLVSNTLYFWFSQGINLLSRCFRISQVIRECPPIIFPTIG